MYVSHTINLIFCRNFKSLIDDEMYIIPEKVYSWIQGVITSAFNDFEENNKQERELTIQGATYYVNIIISKGE